MTPEEQIARRILADAFQYYSRGPLSSVREAELRDLIAAAIQEAVAAEREGCAAVAEAATRMSYWSGFVRGGMAAARAIRARGKQP